jgi:hypothetical protein
LALFPWPLIAPFNVPAQELESAALRGIHDSRFVRMEHPPGLSIQTRRARCRGYRSGRNS